MGTYNGVAVHTVHASAPTSILHSSHRTSLKPPSQVRWPVNLNQLAAISLEDDSDLDRSFTDASNDNIGSVRLLKLLKDSDDESTSASIPPSRLRRPRSTYARLQTGQQQKQQVQKGGIPVARSSSLQGFNPSQETSGNTGIPKPPQRTRSDVKPSNNSSGGAAAAPRSNGLRHHQSESLLLTSRRQTTSENPEEMEQIFSEANAIAQRFGSAASGSSSNSLIRAPIVKNGPSSPNSVSMLRKPTGSQVSSLNSTSSAQVQAKSRISAPSKTLSSQSSSSSLRQRASLQAASPREKGTSSPIRVPGSPGSTQSAAAKKLAGLQPSSLARSGSLKHTVVTDSQLSTPIIPLQPASTETQTESESSRAIRELTEELERWKIEVGELRQERVGIDTWRKQISDLQRDLEVALDSLATSEAMVVHAKTEQDSVVSKIDSYEKTIESLKTDLVAEKERAEKEKAEKIGKIEMSLKASEAAHLQQVEKLAASNKELVQKLENAQNEIDQLELQVVPAELQDVHQSLFSATQELGEVKQRNEKLNADLAEEKAKVIREQEDAGQLLGKLSQLQDIISNHIRDNNALKEIVKAHEKCQENAEQVDFQHKKELEQLQSEILTSQKNYTQERDQKARFEQAYQEQQYQLQHFQQQIQMQQSQLLQQQTDIVNLRATLEVEQKQASLLQQRLQEEQLRNAQYGRRVSMDGDPNSSFIMSPDMLSGSNHMNMVPGGSENILGSMGMQPLSSVNSNIKSPLGANSMMSVGIQSVRNFDANSTGALPPIGNSISQNSVSSGGMVGPMSVAGVNEAESKPVMTHRGSSGSISGISGLTNSNRLSAQGESLTTGGNSGNNASSNNNQTVEDLRAQLQHLIKEKERLQADLSKIPISGGGPMTRRKAEMLEEQMDETEQAIGKVRYSIRMRS
ncbi:hypothetical protein BGZ76_006505 [Entomortierella beljakovae]|nr:hypothetical protein BGZ76_006505 [Entomortierella beljakovae]